MSRRHRQPRCLLGGVLVTLAMTAIGFVGAVVLGTVRSRCSGSARSRRCGWRRGLRRGAAQHPAASLLILVVLRAALHRADLLAVHHRRGLPGPFGAAFVCEAVAAGINTVPVGQAEAARSLGFTFTQALAFVILPPAFRQMVQPLVNIFIGIVLGSSLAAAVGVSELTNRTQVLNLQSAEAVVLFLVSGVLYLVVALLGGTAGGVLERRLRVAR